jgi:hypothetical protein
LPSTDNGNLIDAAVRIFDKHLFGSVIKKKIYLDSFVKAIGVVRNMSYLDEEEYGNHGKLSALIHQDPLSN